MLTSPTGINRPRDGRSPGGFTLIELTVVLVIIVIMSGITLLAMGPALRDAKLRAGCRVVASALNYARSRAAATNSTVRVSFGDGHSVEVEVSTTDPTEGTQLKPLTTSAGKLKRLPPGIVVTKVEKPNQGLDEKWIEFKNLGQADNASIELMDISGQTKYVIVDPITGRCRIQTDAQTTDSSQTVK